MNGWMRMANSGFVMLIGLFFGGLSIANNAQLHAKLMIEMTKHFGG